MKVGTIPLPSLLIKNQDSEDKESAWAAQVALAGKARVRIQIQETGLQDLFHSHCVTNG